MSEGSFSGVYLGRALNSLELIDLCWWNIVEKVRLF
jgi:hypothetical protein